MKDFKLTPKELQNNYQRFFTLIEKFFPERSSSIIAMYKNFGEERLMFAPASGTNYYHNAFPGGYVDHVLRVIKFSKTEYDHYKSMGLDVSNFELKELLFAAMHHDLGKLGFIGDGKDGYIPNDSEWHKKNQGKMYKPNEHIPFSLVQDRSLFLLQSSNVTCSWNEYLGIRIHDGIYDKSNEAYFFARQLNSKLRNNLPQILHNADMAASRFEFERWAKATNSFNTKKIPMNNLPKKTQIDEPVNEFAAIFGNATVEK